MFYENLARKIHWVLRVRNKVTMNECNLEGRKEMFYLMVIWCSISNKESFILSHGHNSTYHGLYYTSCETLAGTRTGWNEKYLSVSTIGNRSNDPSDYEERLNRKSISLSWRESL